MPITNTKGLEALKALSTGGSEALNAYRSAQGKEAASRTTALQGALGGDAVAAAANKAQAEYAPKVPTAGLGVDDLGAAANQYLNKASAKLAASNYEDQQNLALQAEALRRQNSMLSDVEKLALQGQADSVADSQRTAAQNQANTDQGQVTGLGQAEQRRGDLMRALYAADQNLQGTNQALASGALGQDLTQVSTAEAQAKAARDALTAFDQAQLGANKAAAGVLGRDTAGLDSAYKAATDTGNFQQYNDLVNFLGGQAENVTAAQLADRNRAIDVGGQERLKHLAMQNFGVNPDVAAGMFRAGEGGDLGQVGKIADEEAYKAGKLSPKEEDAQVAEVLGFEPSAMSSVKSQSKLSNEDIVATVQRPEWEQIQGIYNATSLGQVPGGYAGFQKQVQDYVNSIEGLSETDKVALVNLANARFKAPIMGASGSDKTAVGETE